MGENQNFYPWLHTKSEIPVTRFVVAVYTPRMKSVKVRASKKKELFFIPNLTCAKMHQS